MNITAYSTFPLFHREFPLMLIESFNNNLKFPCFGSPKHEASGMSPRPVFMGHLGVYMKTKLSDLYVDYQVIYYIGWYINPVIILRISNMY